MKGGKISMDKAKCVILGIFLVVGLLISSSAFVVAISSNISGERVNQPNGPEDNEPPVADADGPYYDRMYGEVKLDGSGSHDPDGTITGYRWNLGRGYSDWTTNPVITISLDNIVFAIGPIKLQVKDDDGATDSDVTLLIVSKSMDNKEGAGENKNSDSAISVGPMSKFLGQILSKKRKHIQVNPFANLFNQFKIKKTPFTRLFNNIDIK